MPAVRSNKQLVACRGALQWQYDACLSRGCSVCTYVLHLVPLLQTFYRVLTDNMAKYKLADAEIRKILEQIYADNILI